MRIIATAVIAAAVLIGALYAGISAVERFERAVAVQTARTA